MTRLGSESVPRVLLKFDCMARWIYPQRACGASGDWRITCSSIRWSTCHVRARHTVLLPMMFLPLVTVTSVLSLGRMMASAAFSPQCGGFSMCGSVLRASCKDDAGVARAASFDLDTCVGFLFRVGLSCDPGTNLPYSSGCGQCALSGTTMWCVCPEERGIGPEWIWMSTDLGT